MPSTPASTAPKVQFLLVLAGWVMPTMLDPETTRRCAAALKKWKTGKYHYIVVSGGKFQQGQRKTAAMMMSTWLIEHGVPSRNILGEPLSVDTKENIENTLRVVREFMKDAYPDHAYRITFVTNPFHGLRAKAIFYWSMGWFGNHLSPAWHFPSPKQILLELLGTLFILFFDPRCERPFFERERQKRRDAAKT